MNKKYSYKDLTGLEFSKVDAKEFDGTEIIGTCFSQSVPKTKIFPLGMTGVSFVKCNLDNIDVQAGNTQKDCCHRQWKVQNDLEPWIVSGLLDTPVEPLYMELYQELNISINPADSPNEKLDEPITTKKMKEASISEMEIIK